LVIVYYVCLISPNQHIMKNLIFLFIVTCLISCEKSEDSTPVQNSNTPPPPPSSNFKFSCKINGTSWGTDSTTSTYFFNSDMDFRVLTCIGFDSMRYVGLGCSAQGIHTMYVNQNSMQIPAETVMTYEGFKNGVWLEDYASISGKVHFTAFDSIAQTVSGTFESIMVEPNVNDTVIITNGVFSGLYFDVVIL
jgi:hypothetical protein